MDDVRMIAFPWYQEAPDTERFIYWEAMPRIPFLMQFFSVIYLIYSLKNIIISV